MYVLIRASRYSAVNNYRLKNIFCVISPIFSRNHRSYLDMLSEIVFLQDKLNAIGYREMLYDELLLFIVQIEDNKTIFQQQNTLPRTAATAK